MAWDSAQYLKFFDERKQPCTDLLSRLYGDFNKILDLGCGPGNSTVNLFRKYGGSHIIGFDSDDDMLKRAQKDYQNLEFIKGSAPEDFNKLKHKFDLIFSNACIHWISNQNKLVDGVYELLNNNGTFAAQFPVTDEAPFYKILYRLIKAKWTSLSTIENFHNLTCEEYYNLFAGRFKNITMWQSNYYHITDREMVLEWYKGSGLRPYLAQLSNSEQTEFLADLQKAIDRDYPLLTDGKVFLIMPRQFFIVQKQ